MIIGLCNRSHHWNMKRVGRRGRLLGTVRPEEDMLDDVTQKHLLQAAGISSDVLEEMSGEERKQTLAAILESNPVLLKKYMAHRHHENSSDYDSAHDLDSLPETSSPCLTDEPESATKPDLDIKFHCTQISVTKPTQSLGALAKNMSRANTSESFGKRPAQHVLDGDEEEVTHQHDTQTCRVDKENIDISAVGMQQQEMSQDIVAETQGEDSSITKDDNVDGPRTLNYRLAQEKSTGAKNCDHSSVHVRLEPFMGSKQVSSLAGIYSKHLKQDKTMSLPSFYTPQHISDPNSYTQVIKLMLDMYRRQVSRAHKQMAGLTKAWGRPVTAGPHARGCLVARHDVMQQDEIVQEGESGGRRILRSRLHRGKQAQINVGSRQRRAVEDVSDIDIGLTRTCRHELDDQGNDLQDFNNIQVHNDTSGTSITSSCWQPAQDEKCDLNEAGTESEHEWEANDESIEWLSVKKCRTMATKRNKLKTCGDRKWSKEYQKGYPKEWCKDSQAVSKELVSEEKSRSRSVAKNKELVSDEKSQSVAKNKGLVSDEKSQSVAKNKELVSDEKSQSVAKNRDLVSDERCPSVAKKRNRVSDERCPSVAKKRDHVSDERCPSVAKNRNLVSDKRCLNVAKKFKQAGKVMDKETLMRLECEDLLEEYDTLLQEKYMRSGQVVGSSHARDVTMRYGHLDARDGNDILDGQLDTQHIQGWHFKASRDEGSDRGPEILSQFGRLSGHNPSDEATLTPHVSSERRTLISSNVVSNEMTLTPPNVVSNERTLTPPNVVSNEMTLTPPNVVSNEMTLTPPSVFQYGDSNDGCDHNQTRSASLISNDNNSSQSSESFLDSHGNLYSTQMCSVANSQCLDNVPPVISLQHSVRRTPTPAEFVIVGSCNSINERQAILYNRADVIVPVTGSKSVREKTDILETQTTCKGHLERGTAGDTESLAVPWVDRDVRVGMNETSNYFLINDNSERRVGARIAQTQVTQASDWSLKRKLLALTTTESNLTSRGHHTFEKRQKISKKLEGPARFAFFEGVVSTVVECPQRMMDSDDSAIVNNSSDCDSTVGKPRVDNQNEVIVSDNMCPICGKCFQPSLLEAHASSCGEEFPLENHQDEQTVCVSCKLQVPPELLQDHQAVCLHRDMPAKRITRSRKECW